MGWRWMTTVAATAVIMLSYGAAVAAVKPREDTNVQLEPLQVNLRGLALSRQQAGGKEREDSSFGNEPRINYDYFVQPVLETTRQLPPAVGHAFISKELHNYASGTTEKKPDARKQETQQQGDAEQYQEEQVWPDRDPFSVFYDSMFPEMESVIPEEDTHVKNAPRILPQPTREGPPSATKPVAATQASATSLPDTSVTEVLRPSMAPLPLSSSSMLSTLSSPMPPLLNKTFDYKQFENLIARMSVVLEKFGLSKSFTRKIFKEEEKFLNSLMHVKPLREKLNTISHLKLSAVTSKLNPSHLLSKYGLKDIFRDISSKVNLTRVASRLGLPEMAFQVSLTDLISKFDMDDIAHIVDLVEVASNFSLKDVTSKMNIGHLNEARLQQMPINLSRILAHIINLESVQRAMTMLGINKTFMDGVFGRVETSARDVSDDDNEGKLLLLPLFDTVSLDVVQTLGFTVLLFFLLLSAYSFITLKTGTIAREGSPRPHAPLLPRPSDWNLDNVQDWKAAVDATEATDLPWKHRNDHDEGQDQRDPIVPSRPIPVPDPGALHRLGHRPPGHLRTHPQHAKTRRGPLIVPVVNFRSDHHVSHPNKHLHTSDPQPAAVRPHHPSLRPQPPRHSFAQHPMQQPFAEPQPYEPDHYDKHRHFASYEDDYEYEGNDKDVENYFLDNSYQQHHGPHSEFESARTPGDHWHSSPTTTSTHAGNFQSYHQTPSIRATWQQRRTTPQPPPFPTTYHPSTTTTTTTSLPTPTPTPLPNTRNTHSRPTSKYAQRITSSPSDKTRLKTRRKNFSSVKMNLDEPAQV